MTTESVIETEAVIESVRHTGGDWAVEDSSPIRIIAQRYPRSEYPPVILATMHIGSRSLTEVQANASLMAQAADLAFACQALLSIYEEAQRGGDGASSTGRGPDWYDRNAVEYLVSEARATLGKAKPEGAA